MIQCARGPFFVNPINRFNVDSVHSQTYYSFSYFVLIGKSMRAYTLPPAAVAVAATILKTLIFWQQMFRCRLVAVTK